MHIIKIIYKCIFDARGEVSGPLFGGVVYDLSLASNHPNHA